MSNLNRRDFLKASAASAAIAAVPQVVHSLTSSAPSGQISVWTTGGDQRHAKVTPLAWKSAPAHGEAINIDSERQFQEVLGFGAAFTDAACFTFNRLDPAARHEIFRELFDPKEAGLSVSRICLGSSDYATKPYSYSEGADPDPELSRFSIEHDREYIIPMLREARAVNPSMWILGSPWSPPAWMKFNGSMLGGCMRRKWLGVYAKYFDRFLAEYAKAGVRVNSITPQNEVDTDQDGRMPACAWPQEYEIEFVRDHLGPLMSKSANPADIWILDHNYKLWGRVLSELEEETVRQYVKGVAWHGYVGTPDAMTKVQTAYPSVGQFWTEGGPDFEKPGYETEWAKWGTQFTDILRNQARCIIGWNYALDQKGRPNIGPFNCAGLLTVDSSSLKITRSAMYWAMRHFSSHVRLGARIVHSSGEIPYLSHVVARNSNGEFAAIMTNAGRDAAEVSLVFGSSSVGVTLAPDSVTTLVWK